MMFNSNSDGTVGPWARPFINQCGIFWTGLGVILILPLISMKQYK